MDFDKIKEFLKENNIRAEISRDRSLHIYVSDKVYLSICSHKFNFSKYFNIVDETKIGNPIIVHFAHYQSVAEIKQLLGFGKEFRDTIMPLVTKEMI